MKNRRNAIMDDGINPELLFGASPSDYNGIFEIPIVRSPKCPIYNSNKKSNYIITNRKLGISILKIFPEKGGHPP